MNQVVEIPRKVIKRDGRVVDFDQSRIREAVRKAMLSVGEVDEQKLAEVVNYVLRVLAEKYGTAKMPHVEDIQDIVELALTKFDLYEVAKAYILYRKERERIREEKKRILERDYVDEVDKKFSINAIRLMASRYLLRDNTGRLIEGPKQLFQRVAALIVIPDILYDSRIFDKDGKQPRWELDNFNPVEYEGKLGLGRTEDGSYEVTWNKHHLERMRSLYEYLNDQGKMRVSWSQFIEKLKNGEFEEYYKNYREYYELMVDKKFMPNSPTLFNAGARLGQLSACFVLPVEDDMESIMKSARDAAMIFKSGGGIGINYSPLRPEGDTVFSTFGVASGPVSFMRIIDVVTDVVKQGGKRRGANMGILEIWHPDIEKFVTAKSKEGFLENFNISVLITPDFWSYYHANKPYPLINPRDKSVWRTIDPKHLFREIADMAWKTADPGVLFLDNINRRNPLKKIYGDIRSTNPCGEQPLYPYESCNLGSINLYAFAKNDGGKLFIDWSELEKAVKIALRFLDNVIDVNNYPIREIGEMTKKTRRVGLGIMGLADLLYALRIPYNSEEGFALMSKLMEFISYHAIKSSVELAKERGSFPDYHKSAYAEGKLPIEGYYHREWWTMDWDSLAEDIRRYGIRNSHTTTVAPTGSISMLVDVSSGLEPQFAIVFEKRVSVGTFYYTDLEFERQMKELGLYKETLLKKISDNGGSLQGIEEIPEELRRVFLVAYDVPWWDHIRAQYEIQKWVDASVSKTINMPSWVTVDDVMKAYLFAYNLGLKGITIYRDSSKSAQVLVTPSQRLSRYIAVTPNKTLQMMEKLGVKPSIGTEDLQQEAAQKKQISLVTSVEGPSVSEDRQDEACPSCDSTNLVYQEGCIKCLDCGWSSCVVA
ncbi:MAG: adenosylcobalamin-dependent ribonucleoside-diphosphate reductase [Aigarchaeota archaeon]|nr:adenosylcobalamin-dependent ribonucleoside-diphosphate reductase [Candidatus Pelearchaeum maunauluense]